MSFTYEYPRPAVTVDAVIFRESNSGWMILLIKRGNDPYKDMWALPGGFIDMNETLEEAIARELFEETGLENMKLEQLHTFSTVNRDPRHRTISTVFWGIIQSSEISLNAGDDASEAAWFAIDKLPDLAFDHSEVIQIALRKINQPPAWL